MIVVDTSALMAIVRREAQAFACMTILEGEGEVLISAGTMAEALIVANRRGLSEEMDRLIEGLGMEVAPLTAASAKRVAEAYERWGEGVHPATLNLGDCFAYELAKSRGCRLLFVGEDFSKTDLESAL
ncbi:MAG: type II toxin-antitoxin system VapC family toxin [Caulobacteraceae bacterium]